MTLMKGAFVVFQTPAPVPTDVIVFQFNSETLTRKIEPPKDNQPATGASVNGTGGATSTSRAPVETLSVTIELDASDQLERGDPIATGVGLHPAIAQLELLLYPPSTLLILNEALTRAGMASISPTFTPLVLFVWGTTRVLPVQVTSVSVTEQHFDNRLNPLIARVEVGLTVRGKDELQEPFKTLAMVTHVAKEGLARMGTVQSAFNVSASFSF